MTLKGLELIRQRVAPRVILLLKERYKAFANDEVKLKNRFMSSEFAGFLPGGKIEPRTVQVSNKMDTKSDDAKDDFVDDVPIHNRTVTFHPTDGTYVRISLVLL